MSVIQMRVSDLIRYRYVDYASMHIKCAACNRKYGRHFDLGEGKYWASHHDRAKCRKAFTYNNLDIFDWKRDDDQYQEILRSLREVHTLPIARIYCGWIVDGGHRLAGALDLGLKTVLVEDGLDGCASDSNNWYYGQPIDTTSVREDE